MTLVCIDTQILVWGVKQEANSEQDEMIGKAINFLEHLDENKVKVIVPAIVVAELLMPIPIKAQSSFMSLIQENFLIVPFDGAAAAHFAQIWQQNKDHNILEEVKAGFHNATRSEMKADYMIVATAVARRARCIYSNDGPLTKFAKGCIEVRRMPDIARQSRLNL